VTVVHIANEQDLRTRAWIETNCRWAVENEGVTPDIDVENWPKDVIAGHDPQLERAVQEALRMLKEHPVERMGKEPPPPTWGKRRDSQ
jgi:tricorn protease